MDEERMYSIEEVAVILGVSYKTLCNWYAYKRKFPDDVWSQKLPEYILGGDKKTKRLWKDSDLEKLFAFKTELPRGRGGVLGKVTQVWYHNNKGNKNE